MEVLKAAENAAENEVDGMYVYPIQDIVCIDRSCHFSSEAIIVEENRTESLIDDQRAKKDSHGGTVDPESHLANAHAQVSIFALD